MSDTYETKRRENALLEQFGYFDGQCLRLLHESIGVIRAQREEIEELKRWVEMLQGVGIKKDVAP